MTNIDDELDKLIELHTIDIAYAARRQKTGTLPLEREAFKAAIKQLLEAQMADYQAKLLADYEADVADRVRDATNSAKRSEEHYWIDLYSREIKMLDGSEDMPEIKRLKSLRKQHQDRLAQLQKELDNEHR